MNNIVILPLVIPLIASISNGLLTKANCLSAFFKCIVVAPPVVLASIVLIRQIAIDGIQVLQLGGWEAPFGISFVADMFSALLVSPEPCHVMLYDLSLFIRSEKTVKRITFIRLFNFCSPA